jgi:phage tail-like protein
MKSADIRELIPAVIRQAIKSADPADALLRIMEALQRPSEDVLDEIDLYFDPRRTPDRFLPMLASWVNIDRFLGCTRLERKSIGSASILFPLLREWIAAEAHISKWSGTEKGLRMLLEAATGARGFQIIEGLDHDGLPRPFHLRLIAPAEANGQVALIERILELEKPAYVTSEPVEFMNPNVAARSGTV